MSQNRALNHSKKTIESWHLILFFIVLILLSSGCGPKQENTISLEGEWQVKLDSLSIGETENWANDSFQGLPINLPGTLDDAEIGKPNTLKPELNNYVLSNLTRKYQYIGKAWYQKEIEIPSNWKGKKIGLTIERVIWESTVFVDGKEIGKAESLIGSHEYDLTEALSPGKHLLTIRIDNSNKYPLINVPGNKYPDPINQDMAHGYTNHTQIKWNGILGDITLEADGKNAPFNLQVYPDLKNNALQITYEQEKISETEMVFELVDAKGEKLYAEPIGNIEKEANVISFQIERPQELKYWDEFNPNIYEVRIISGIDTLKTSFGYKEIAQQNGDLTLNGKRIFLRGNLECSIFPLTGHPPMEKEGWAKLIHQAKAYGLNHLRFHSWCPPRAAFEAADEAGFYFQVELAHWSLRVGEDKKTTEFLRREADKLLRDYGNHPSFILMALGNELQGDITLLNQITAELKEKDNRHLYATTAFSFQKPAGQRPEPEDEYFIAQWTDKGWIRGQGIFNNKAPHFNTDYSKNSGHVEIPLISHEIGQYAVYPDMSEISKYTGVLQPLNFIAIRDDLKNKGLLNFANDFTNASGKLAALLYKEEIERALKTPSFDGFQLLQLQDFPGQGTALVGLLNAFWESKGIISAEEFRKFNSEVVPLIRFEKAVYESGERFSASVEVANFFKEMQAQTLDWTIKDAVGNTIKKGTLSNVNLTIGNNQDLGIIDIPIQTDNAQHWIVTVSLKDSAYENSWSIWVYPEEVSISSKEVLVTASIDEATVALGQGRKVLLNPKPISLEGIEGRFVPVFWSPVHFPNQPSTMGLLMDDKHPALAKFPTSTHTDWQWWNLCINSKSVSIDSLNVDPIVRVIDNFVTNRSLSNLFEAKVGEGKLVFSSIDLLSDLKNRPVARQLRHSLLNYMESDNFVPSKSLNIDSLESVRLNKSQNNFSTKDIYD
ncbi:sugar-binding domain-containing protein [Spongiivirga citrea]|uniref:Glycoside hydrolase family 2 n=1 Tax=Spongiivirga citrea TaxID=1481457 RepID=A0A6M0CPR5_9FLAO|nr:sugar-binding domain-containing protein [Spongiivirga citrea]NER17859.1 glycoside hydrolase family 2 [Spongiivirga citrea]